MTLPCHSRRRPILTGLAIALVAFAGPSPGAAQEKDLWVDGGKHRKADLDQPLRGSSIASLAEKVSPAVVNIIVSYASGNKLGGFFESDGWSPASAQGSGFIIHPTGYVLSNHHVIEGAQSITVRLWDDREFEARVVGIDPPTDIALLKIEPGDKEVSFPIAELGDSDSVRVGDNVLAIGNPLGLTHTVTAGIVSALERRDLAPGGRELYAEFIQTDASINPGNSGGPLISLHGEVIGINTAVNRQGQGIGFAIPINTVKTLIPHLHANGYVVRTWLGIRMQEMTLALARSYGMNRAQGALVTEVIDDGPAQKAGLQPGDVILKFDGKTIRKSDILPWLASTAGATQPVEVEILRSGKQRTIPVQLEEQPNQKAPPLPASRVDEPIASGKKIDLGIEVKALAGALARQLGASDSKGVVVVEIEATSPAKDSGLRQRDVILEVGETAVLSKSEFQSAAERVKPGEVMRLKVIRGGRVVYIAFER